MNLNDPIVMQYITGAGLTVLGLGGWFLPYRWNLLRLRRGLAKLFPEKINLLIPKILGTIFTVVGLAIIILTATVGRMDQ